MGALCRADTTDTREWRLFNSNSFCNTEQAVTPLLPLPHRPHTLYIVTHKDLTFAIFTKWLSISARIFSFWAVKISRTSQKLTCNTTFISHSKNSIFIMEHKNINSTWADQHQRRVVASFRGDTCWIRHCSFTKQRGQNKRGMYLVEPAREGNHIGS